MRQRRRDVVHANQLPAAPLRAAPSGVLQALSHPQRKHAVQLNGRPRLHVHPVRRVEPAAPERTLAEVVLPPPVRHRVPGQCREVAAGNRRVKRPQRPGEERMGSMRPTQPARRAGGRRRGGATLIFRTTLRSPPAAGPGGARASRRCGSTGSGVRGPPQAPRQAPRPHDIKETETDPRGLSPPLLDDLLDAPDLHHGVLARRGPHGRGRSSFCRHVATWRRRPRGQREAGAARHVEPSERGPEVESRQFPRRGRFQRRRAPRGPASTPRRGETACGQADVRSRRQKRGSSSPAPRGAATNLRGQSRRVDSVPDPGSLQAHRGDGDGRDQVRGGRPGPHPCRRGARRVRCVPRDRTRREGWARSTPPSAIRPGPVDVTVSGRGARAGARFARSSVALRRAPPRPRVCEGSRAGGPRTGAHSGPKPGLAPGGPRRLETAAPSFPQSPPPRPAPSEAGGPRGSPGRLAR